MLKLVDVLGIKAEDYTKYKIHFATGGNDNKDALRLFYSDGFEKDQELQSKRNFERQFVISLIFYDVDIWLFAGVFEVIEKGVFVPSSTWPHFKYTLNKMPIQTDLIGRALVRYVKKYRQSYVYLENQTVLQGVILPVSDMEICEIRRERITVKDFPGFDWVNISYDILKKVVSENIPSWKNALSKVKGVYLIVDSATGKQYVGSANGTDALWQRWSDYAKTGHGKDVELIKVLETNGEDYKKNFNYSVLEICNLNTSDAYIIGREQHWKESLMTSTRQFGFNRN